MPPHLLGLANQINRLNARVGQALSWMALLLVLVQFALVVMSSVFRTNILELQELLLYINSLMFLGGAGFTLLTDGHVRVDIFYEGASERTRHRVNLFGGLFLLMPLMGLLWWSATPFVVTSWSSFEGSIETSGLQGIFVLKSFILFFALAMTLQGISEIIRAADGLLVGREDSQEMEKP